jgi:sporulation protein YlmC with PRC-barrel domain
MTQDLPLRIGAAASCSDGACGHVSRIIVNPAAREVTHLVVDQKHRNGPGRLVPLGLVDATTGHIQLCCTLAEFQALRPAQETEVVPDLDPNGPHNTRSYPSASILPLGGGVLGTAGGGEAGRDLAPGRPEAPEEVTTDFVPSGEVEIGRETVVCATDGEIGQVQGLAVEPGGHLVTHVLFQQGHMLGRKEVAVPVGSVIKIGTLLIRLSLTKHQAKDLPSADIDRPAG